MSSKNTLYRDKTNHFYTEAFDDDTIYFDTGSVVLKLDAVHILCLARMIDLDSLRKQAALTDEQIRKHIENYVDERIASTGLLRLAGFMVYGSPDDPREVQIEAGMKYYTELRDKLVKLVGVLDCNDTKGHNFSFGMEGLL